MGDFVPPPTKFGGGETINTKTARIVHTTIEVPFDEAFSEVRCRPVRFDQEDREKMGPGKLGVWGGDPFQRAELPWRAGPLGDLAWKLENRELHPAIFEDRVKSSTFVTPFSSRQPIGFGSSCNRLPTVSCRHSRFAVWGAGI